MSWADEIFGELLHLVLYSVFFYVMVIQVLSRGETKAQKPPNLLYSQVLKTEDMERHQGGQEAKKQEQGEGLDLLSQKRH